MIKRRRFPRRNLVIRPFQNDTLPHLADLTTLISADIGDRFSLGLIKCDARHCVTGRIVLTVVQSEEEKKGIRVSASQFPLIQTTPDGWFLPLSVLESETVPRMLDVPKEVRTHFDELYLAIKTTLCPARSPGVVVIAVTAPQYGQRTRRS